ncbi:protein-glutamate O-methyltransferase [Sphingobium cloacae]|uniref:Protein-glutamate O-methyltransferase n=1 Tax=Sphingobium cloacae TaxID=120107 RepID=A0A1E1F5V9_9SPHN|nr:protein-glutamate O-methyltransferase [Sphingobium cloacae]
MNPASSATHGGLRLLSALLEARTGQVLSPEREWRAETALKPLLRAYGFGDAAILAAHLARHRDPDLEAAVVDALLNNESSFFRDLQIFGMIRREILPDIRARGKDRRLRIWSAGCSTGQEAYSLAIQLCNDAGHWRGWRIEILATDVSATAIERARAGVFPQMDVQRGLSVNDLIQWFDPVEGGWRANDRLRGMIDFRQDNLLDPHVPSGAYDLLLCRNVMLYFTQERRQKMFGVLQNHSHDHSVLLLGAGETAIGHGDPFVAHPDFRGAYRLPSCAEDAARRAV